MLPRRLAFAMLLAAMAPAGADTVVKAYNTYRGAPYAEDNGGLAHELVRYVNRKLEGFAAFPRAGFDRSGLIVDWPWHPR